MTQWKLFEGDTCEYATLEWYADREAAHHLEQGGHRERLHKAADYVLFAMANYGAESVVDLGCGDGGLLSLLQNLEIYNCWGYDAQPQNIHYAENVRNVDVRLTDFQSDSSINYGDIAVMTEVLEHLVDPHKTLRDLPSNILIASSPYGETGDAHYEFHLWAFDIEGYKDLVAQAGYKVVLHDVVWLNQIVLAVRD